MEVGKKLRTKGVGGGGEGEWGKIFFGEGEKGIFWLYTEKRIWERRLTSKEGRAEGGHVPNFQVNLS